MCVCVCVNVLVCTYVSSLFSVSFLFVCAAKSTTAATVDADNLPRERERVCKGTRWRSGQGKVELSYCHDLV